MIFSYYLTKIEWLPVEIFHCWTIFVFRYRRTSILRRKKSYLTNFICTAHHKSSLSKKRRIWVESAWGQSSRLWIIIYMVWCIYQHLFCIQITKLRSFLFFYCFFLILGTKHFGHQKAPGAVGWLNKENLTKQNKTTL